MGSTYSTINDEDEQTYNDTTTYVPTNLKLESQRILEFSGRYDEWQKWKNRTQCAFIGSGYERILDDEDHAAIRSDLNRIVYSQLAVATSGGTAYHIVKAHDRRKDGHAAWRDLCQWFDGDAMKNETADNLRAKLESYRMTSSTGAQQYINSFMTTYRELNNIPGEGWSAGHTKSVFLKGIQDPDYDTFVAIQKDKNQSLDEMVLALRRAERELLSKRSEKRKLNNIVRRMMNDRKTSGHRKDDGERVDYEEYESNPKKARRTKDKYGYLCLTQMGYISVLDKMWMNELSTEEKDYVVSFNSKIKHSESTQQMVCPPRFKNLKKGEVKNDDDDKKTTRRKKVGFNLEQEDEEKKEE